jgi:hypothetical protein
MHRVAGLALPTARKFHCAADVGGAIYVAGADPPATTGNILHALSTAPPCAVTAPTNGALGTCTSTLAAGSTCQFTCNDGYGASGTTSCAAGGTTLTAATCATNVWFSRNALPAVSLVPLQGALSFGTQMYTVANPPVGPTSVGASGDFHNYDSTTDLWATGTPPPAPSPAPPRARLLPSHSAGIARFTAVPSAIPTQTAA